MTQSNWSTSKGAVKVSDVAVSISEHVRRLDALKILPKHFGHVSLTTCRLKTGLRHERGLVNDMFNQPPRFAHGGVGKSSRLSFASARCAMTAWDVFWLLGMFRITFVPDVFPSNYTGGRNELKFQPSTEMEIVYFTTA